MQRLMIPAAVAAALALAGCGKQGDLARPAPLSGPDERTEAERETERAPRSATARALEEPAAQNTTIRENPIEGGPRDPRAGPRG